MHDGPVNHVRTIDLSKLEPYVSGIDGVIHNTDPLADFRDKFRLDQCMVGSCANGTLDDLACRRADRARASGGALGPLHRDARLSSHLSRSSPHWSALDHRSIGRGVTLTGERWPALMQQCMSAGGLLEQLEAAGMLHPLGWRPAPL